MNNEFLTIELNDKICEILRDNDAYIDDVKKDGQEFVFNLYIEGDMGNDYEFQVRIDGTEEDFVKRVVYAISKFDPAEYALQSIEEGSVAETDDIRWYCDAADELGDLCNSLASQLDEYAGKQGWGI